MQNITQKIHNLLTQKELVFVGISGLGGSGKSTLAANIAKNIEKTTVVSVDHFYLPSEYRQKSHTSSDIISNCFDWNRLEQFLQALNHRGSCTRYQMYNWNTDTLDVWQHIDVDGVVIIEGVYCLQDRFIDLYDLSIWVDTPEDIRVRRSISRDMEGRFYGKDEKEVHRMWRDIWIPQDNRYFDTCRPDMQAHMVVSGS